MPFAQLVIGPPGSGKSTYCDGMQQLLTALRRKCSVVNLDPANDHTSYLPAVDVRNLVSLSQVMEEEDLGPNGGILYALEELEHNLPWLEHGLGLLDDDYILFDCPGQLVVIHLVDSYSLTLPTLYLSMLLLSLRSMLQMDLPHLNVFTKIDNLASYPPLPMPLSFYTEARSLEHILPLLEDEEANDRSSLGRSREEEAEPSSRDIEMSSRQRQSKFAALSQAIVELVDDYGLVGFETLAVEDRASMLQLLRAVDGASGYAFGAAEGANGTIWEVAVREGGGRAMEVRDIEERWVQRRASFDETERQMWEDEGKLEKGQGDAP